MKKIALALAAVLFLFAVFSPAADAHWRGGGRVFLGFGAGLLTGYLFAPRVYYPAPVYVPPPVYVTPTYVTPPPVVEYSSPAYGQPPVAPGPPPGYTENANIPPPPGPQSKCREWRLMERRYEDRWDSWSGGYRTVPVEKWGWAEIPCN